MYECLINIGDEKDLEIFRKTLIYEPEMEKVIKIGTWVHFDVDYLKLFQFSKEYDDLINSTLVVALHKKRA